MTACPPTDQCEPGQRGTGPDLRLQGREPSRGAERVVAVRAAPGPAQEDVADAGHAGRRLDGEAAHRGRRPHDAASPSAGDSAVAGGRLGGGGGSGRQRGRARLDAGHGQGRNPLDDILRMATGKGSRRVDLTAGPCPAVRSVPPPASAPSESPGRSDFTVLLKCALEVVHAPTASSPHISSRVQWGVSSRRSMIYRILLDVPLVYLSFGPVAKW